jgi:serine/threonine protein kinase
MCQESSEASTINIGDVEHLFNAAIELGSKDSFKGKGRQGVVNRFTITTQNNGIMEFALKKIKLEVSDGPLMEMQIREIKILGTFSGQPGFPLFYGCQYKKNIVSESKSNASYTVYIAQELLFLDMSETKAKDIIKGWSQVKFMKEVSIILKAIIRLNEFGVQHSDIKPQNIMLTKDEQNFKLIDYGVTQKNNVKTTEFVGGACYMAPRQILKEETKPEDDMNALVLSIFSILASIEEVFHKSKEVYTSSEGKTTLVYTQLEPQCYSAFMKPHCRRSIFLNCFEIKKRLDFGEYMRGNGEPMTWNFATLLLNVIGIQEWDLSNENTAIIIDNIIKNIEEQEVHTSLISSFGLTPKPEKSAEKKVLKVFDNTSFSVIEEYLSFLEDTHKTDIESNRIENVENNSAPKQPTASLGSFFTDTNSEYGDKDEGKPNIDEFELNLPFERLNGNDSMKFEKSQGQIPSFLQKIIQNKEKLKNTAANQNDPNYPSNSSSVFEGNLKTYPDLVLEKANKSQKSNFSRNTNASTEGSDESDTGKKNRMKPAKKILILGASETTYKKNQQEPKEREESSTNKPNFLNKGFNPKNEKDFRDLTGLKKEEHHKTPLELNSFGRTPRMFKSFIANSRKNLPDIKSSHIEQPPTFRPPTDEASYFQHPTNQTRDPRLTFGPNGIRLI